METIRIDTLLELLRMRAKNLKEKSLKEKELGKMDNCYINIESMSFNIQATAINDLIVDLNKTFVK